MEGRDYQAFLEMINSEDFLYLQKYYTQETIFDIAGVSRSENHHSDYLKWLFSDNMRHGVGKFAVMKMIETAALAAERIGDREGFFADSRNLLQPSQRQELLERLKYGNYQIS